MGSFAAWQIEIFRYNTFSVLFRVAMFNPEDGDSKEPEMLYILNKNAASNFRTS
jgi:hypothetical protein